jgi:hypothetical protein
MFRRFPYTFGQDPVAVAGPGIPHQEANPPSSMVNFRRATTHRTAIETTTVAAQITGAAVEQNIEVEIHGTGYIYGVDVDVVGTTSGNAASVAFLEDGPYSAISSVTFADSNGQLENVTGYHLWLYNLYGGYIKRSPEASLDTLIFNKVTGAVGAGGSFRFHLFTPVAISRRTLLGLLGNQDKAQTYYLRTNLNTSANIYSVAPTTGPNVTIFRHYDNYAVPARVNANNAPQAIKPEKFGVLHFVTQTVNPGSAPLGGSTINHYLPRTSHAIRLLILVFRANGSRATAESNLPTRLTLKLGDTVIFNETPAYRRKLMWDRYMMDAPAGVLAYDFMTDVIGLAGDEFGEDWVYANGLSEMQFEIVYPSGFGSTNNTLTVVTGDLLIPADVDVYA